MPTSQAGVGSIWQLGSVNQKVLKGSRLLPGLILQKRYIYRRGPSVTVAVAVVSHHHAAVLFLLLLFKRRFNFGSLQTSVPGERDRDDATCLWVVNKNRPEQKDVYWFISPLQIYQPSLMSNGWLDSVGKLDSIFFLLPFGNNNVHVLSLMREPTCSQAQLQDTHLLMHSRHVPHVAHDGPAGHHPQQVTDHAILGAVPESISKLWVVLKIKKTKKCWGKTEQEKVNQVWWNYRTFMATGYMVPPISKLPFLNIMTDVLLMQVPEKRPEARWGVSS